MKTDKIRQAFLNYFNKHEHTVVPGASLIPSNDPTLLFINAGMVQFKDVFLGLDTRPYTRATSSQPCLRVSGKHNDLEQVGYTSRHHTFFEMLGNFSFGDYFKREAIRFAWEFLTGVLGIPAEKLWVTVFKDDEEAASIWLDEMHIDKNRFSRCGEKDNFWSMGDTGPCGPCSEIFYDHGEAIAGGPPGSPDQEGDRYVEIWNLVFMQFNRDSKGKMTPLPKPSVDTGMGLERIAAVMQGVHSNYDIDLFKALIADAAKLTHCSDLSDPSLKVIADHIRSSSFLITDGIVPSNEGRGYVLRRIVRRAIRHGHKLGMQKMFFHKLVKTLCKVMGDAYPQLNDKRKIIEEVLLREEEQFARTIEQGLKVFESYLAELKGKVLSGHQVFKLYDTYGFPMDLTAAMAKERGLTIDETGFDREMQEQRERSQAASHFDVDYGSQLTIDAQTQFDGYDTCEEKGDVVAMVRDGQLVDELREGEEGAVVLNRTPFYAESGGQVGDVGRLESDKLLFAVHDTQKLGKAFLHVGKLKSGELHVGDSVQAEVVVDVRKQTAANHSATHLLHAALRKVLGDHVAQKGSYVDGERLRFDFSHFKAISKEELQQIEDLVNEKIRANLDIQTEIMSPEAAKKRGAMALFGEKYGDRVRVLTMGDFSQELCGGTHASRTGDIGLLKIISESGIAAGIRRIEAVTGVGALKYVNNRFAKLNDVESLLESGDDQIINKVQQILIDRKNTEKDIIKLIGQVVHQKAESLVYKVNNIHGINVLSVVVEDVSGNDLRILLDELKSKLDHAVILLAVIEEKKQIKLISGVTKDCLDRFHAGKLMQFVSAKLDGKGGGRSDMAQGAGNNLDKLSTVLEEVPDWVREQL